VQECLEAVDECGAPVVSIAGGEPLLHKDMPEIVRGIIARKRFVYLCTNALLMEKKIDQYEPSPYFVWSIHLDGDREMHDHSVNQEGVYDRCVEAIRMAKERGFRVNINCTLFNDAKPDRVAKFFDSVKAMGVDGITVSPGYAYERARTSSTSCTAARPSNCSATSCRAATPARTGRSASRRCSWTSWPATRPTSARRGATRRVPCSAGSVRATWSAKAM
jgi:hopanoid biosynthesis associated radical SAM protein HpnH